MNIADLHSASSIPWGAIGFWAGAVLIVAWYVVKRPRTPRRDTLGVLAASSAVLLLGALGVMSSVDSIREAREASFHKELREEYGLTTEASLEDVKLAARERRSFEAAAGASVAAYVPRLSGDVLSLYRASDGVLVAPLKS